MKRSVTSFTGRKISSGIASCLLIFVLSSFLASQALAQQIMVTISSGAPGDPLNGPQYVAFDRDGNLFISDTNNSRVRRMDRRNGSITTVVGNGTAGNGGDGGPGINAQLDDPAGLAFTAAGDLLIADPGEGLVRRVSANRQDHLVQGRPEEIITRFAGGGLNPPGALPGTPATDLLLGFPTSVAVDSTNTVYIGTLHDGISGGNIIAVDADTGIYQILAGYPEDPESLAVDRANNVFVGSSIGDYDPVSCGATGGFFSQWRLAKWDRFGSAQVALIAGLALDSSGNVYASAVESYNSVFRLTPLPQGFCFSQDSAASVSLFAGDRIAGYNGDGGPPILGSLNGPHGLAFNGNGNLFIADTGNNVIRGVINGAATGVGNPAVVPLDQNGDPSSVSVGFDGGVMQAGSTAVVIGPTAPVLPAGFELAGTPPVFYDIVTSAQYSGPLTVCIAINPVPPGAALLHFNSASQTWEDLTITPVPPTGPICTQVNSLSPFAIVTPTTQNQAPAITSANNATFQLGMPGSFTVTSTGSPIPTITEAGALPSGVSFLDNGDGTGTLNGTAGTSGIFNVAFTASNTTGDVTQNFSLIVNQAPAITSANNATFTVGASSSFTVMATGFPVPTLSESGALPNGVTFNPATGLLSGTPATGGIFNLTFTAHNGVGADATQSFSLTVNQSPAITSANNATFTVGTAGSFIVTTTGFPTPSLTEAGALPGGVAFTDNHNGTGALSGTPSASGTFNISFTSSNGAGSDATQNFTLTVSGSGSPTATVTPTSINFGNVYLKHLASDKVTLQNTGSNTLTISKISLTLGAHADWDDFFFISLCKSTLAAGKSCPIYVFYYADDLGTRTATLNITDNAPGSPQTVSLTGTAIKKGH